jgi:ArsR family transcriptional regulator, arsenate/arsenite/antimonite-responsive transcriptional repressor
MSPMSERAQLFHALSDETRLAILDRLRGGECCVCDLQTALDAAQSRLSFHLKVLRDAGLVHDRKEGRWSYYKLNPARIHIASRAAAALLEPTRELPQLHQLSARNATSEVGSAAKSLESVDSAGCCG